MNPTIATLAVAALLLLTKAMDCRSTARGLRVASPALEANPIARGLMRRFGVTATILGVFVATVVIVLVAAALTIADGRWEAQATFVALGLLVSGVQALVARHNQAVCRRGPR